MKKTIRNRAKQQRGSVATEKISVFIADDHYFSREGMRELLAHSGIKVVGEADSFSTTKTACFAKNPDVVIYGLNIGDEAFRQSEIEGVKELLRIRNDAKILVFTARDSLTAISTAYKEGARAVVNRRAGPEIILAAIKTVAKGQSYYAPGVAEKLAEMFTKGGELDPRDVLTKREMQIFLLLASGKTASAVARELKLSPITVSNRAVMIRNKIGCSRGDLTRVAMRFHLMRSEE